MRIVCIVCVLYWWDFMDFCLYPTLCSVLSIIACTGGGGDGALHLEHQSLLKNISECLDNQPKVVKLLLSNKFRHSQDQYIPSTNLIQKNRSFKRENLRCLYQDVSLSERPFIASVMAYFQTQPYFRQVLNLSSVALVCRNLPNPVSFHLF